MWIDIIQAYADTLYVATAQRPVPQSRAPRHTLPLDTAVEQPAAAPSPAGWRWLARWRRRRSLAGGLTAAPTTAGGCN